MQHPNKTLSLAALVTGLVTASAGFAQTCNPSIPLTAPDSEFTDHGDGTVTHHRTGLMWMMCLEGQTGTGCAGTPTSMTWSEALTHASSREFATYADWRVPNSKELASIVEDACYEPAINLSHFPNDPGSDVWSSSPDASNSNYAWTLKFFYGYDGVSPKSGYVYVRLVRDEQ